MFACQPEHHHNCTFYYHFKLFLIIHRYLITVRKKFKIVSTFPGLLTYYYYFLQKESLQSFYYMYLVNSVIYFLGVVLVLDFLVVITIT